ncbi:class I SAM-dependent methyltransferase [Flavisphingomonas formosensis]|uniref:class I SAM-dependent methyltransferase n=1 Tax=Flavisphingomonas formosensis TaxID=861534 RepID=UPI0012FCE647|nr:methyltransferase domain-containing protein [Sphingomonas formosensis]
MRQGGLAALTMLLALGACAPHAQDDGPKSSDFPQAARPVAPIVASAWSTEEARDRLREASMVMDRAGIRHGMTVADIGAGEGYYTVRLAARVGAQGRVLAEDVVPAVRDKLADRVTREALDNVSVKLGEPSDPMLPEASFDRIFMVHMYHEISSPYEFLWRMRPALRPDGRVVVVDADRPTTKHGTPPVLLDCEMAAVGYRRVAREKMPQDSYIALYEASGARPEPKAIVPCRAPAPPPPTAPSEESNAATEAN